MVIFETPIFSKIISQLLSDDEYAKLQRALLCDPKSGDVIKNSGGLRKIRWTDGKSGKRGGMRIIYYCLTQHNQLYMLYAYKKSKQADLTVNQIKTLKIIIDEEFGHE